MAKHKCSICNNKASDFEKKPFFQFPKNNERRQQWLEATQFKSDDIKRDTKICFNHFADDDYFTFSTKHTLKSKALPRFNLPNSTNNQTPKPEEDTSENNESISVPQQSIIQPKQRDETIIMTPKVENNQCVQRQIEKYRHSDQKIFFYTGFQSFSIMLVAFRSVLKSESGEIHQEYTLMKNHAQKLSPLNDFFLTLIKLKRGYDFPALADQFGISTVAAEEIFVTWLNLIYNRFGSTDMFPHRDIILKKTTPSFRKKYPNVIGSIDCIEFRIQAPSSLEHQYQCFSHFKGVNTLKALIMIDPNGGICFVSALFNGSISNKAIMEKSHFLRLLKAKVDLGEINHGDNILADESFAIEDILETTGVNITVPRFRINQVEQERINAERTIRRLKSFNILSTRIPVSLLGCINPIYSVCCFLCNFRYRIRKKH